MINLKTMDFIKIPNIILWKEEGKSIISELNNDYKVVLIMDFIENNTSMRNTVIFSLNFMVTECGFIPNSHKDKVNDQFKKILQLLQDKGLLICEEKLIDIKDKDVVKVKVNNEFYKNKFVEILDSEKQIILNQIIDVKVDNNKLYAYFCYLKCRMFKRTKESGSTDVYGGRANFTTWVSFYTINKDLGLSTDTIHKYNDLLVELKIIMQDKTNNWYYSDDPHKTVYSGENVYVLIIDGNYSDCKSRVKQAIGWLTNNAENENKVFTGTKEYLHGNKSYAGKMSAISKKIVNGTVTKEDIVLKNELVEGRDKVVNEKWYVHNLLTKNPNCLITDILDKLGDVDKYNDYLEIEQDLELVDEDGNLQLDDFEAYKWIIVNYNNTPIDKIQGYIKKHRINDGSWGTKEVTV